MPYDMTNETPIQVTERRVYFMRLQGFSWRDVAAHFGLNGESTARAYANRFAARSGMARLSRSSPARQRAGRASAQARWRANETAQHEWTFGVEIEFVGASRLEVMHALAAHLGRHIHYFHAYHSHESRRGATCVGCGAAPDGYNDWKLELDGSVSSNQHRTTGAGGEVVSPILTAERIAEIDLVVKAIKSVGGRVNKKCGLHVHVGVKHLTADQRTNIYQNWYANQDNMHRFVPRSRYVNNQFVHPIQPHVTDRYKAIISGNRDTEGANKYYELNIRPYSKIGTYEVRLHQGSLNYSKIKNWVEFMVAFFRESADGNQITAATPQEMLAVLATKQLLKNTTVTHLKGRIREEII